jgi:chemotaxis protein MotB
MASTDNEVPAPIIVKKVKKGGHGHHGGAWKVAYADFVTAMMAFFLLMWLLNVSTDEQKNAISNYFDPTNPKVSSNESGSGGVLGGMTVSPDGAMTSNTTPLTANNM